MAVTLRNVFFAAVAAMVLSLSACGGGDPDEIRVASATVSLPQAVASATAEVNPGLMAAVKAAKAPVAKPAAAVQSSGHKASAAPQAAMAAPYANFTVGGATEKALPLSATTSTARVITGTQLMNFVEGAIPSLFPEHASDREISGGGVTYQWRLYSNGNILAVGSDGNIYGLGPYVGSDTVARLFGTLIQFTCIVDADMCRPVVVAELVTPRNGAVDVPLTGTVITVPFDRPVVCPQGPITGTFGVVVGTMTCAVTTTTATVTITVTGEMVESSHVTVTLGGFRSMEGVEMVSYSWSFTMAKKPVVPVVPMVRIVTANITGDSIGDAGVSIVDPATRAITQVLPDTEPGGYLLPKVVDVDNQRGVAYMGAGATNVLHRVDVKTGTALPSFYIESKYVGTGIHGVAHSTKTGVVCIATGLWGRQAEISFLRNRFICFDPLTGQKVFNSQNDFLGNSTMIPTKMIYSAARGKFYILMALESGRIDEDFGNGGWRDGYKAGTPGMVVEIDAVTYAKGRTWNVGSMPLDVEILGNILYVVNAGDKSLSKIDLVAGAVTTVNWGTAFPGVSYPTNIEIDLEKGVYYLSDWWDSVRVMSLATDQQIDHIVLGGIPRGMGIIAGSLWVATITLSGSLSEIDRTTRTVKNIVNNVGDAPWDIAIYDNTKP